MRKFLLVVFVGMVLAINLYGLLNEIISYYEMKHVEESYTVIYME